MSEASTTRLVPWNHHGYIYNAVVAIQSRFHDRRKRMMDVLSTRRRRSIRIRPQREQAEGADNKLAAGRALAVRPMIARQMLLTLTHRKMNAHKEARHLMLDL